jgi:hypothetical protein
MEQIKFLTTDQLPSELGDLLDPEKTPDAQFFSIESKSRGHWLVALPVLGFWLVSLAAFISNWNEEQSREPKWVLLFLSFYLILFALAMFLTWRAIKKQIYASGISLKTLRIGLFIHPNALLVRWNREKCCVIPRAALRAIAVRSYLHANRTPATKLIFTDTEGKEHHNIVGINSFGFGDRLDVDREKLLDALKRWAPELNVTM